MGPRRGRTLKCQGNVWACVCRGSPYWSSAWPWWRSWSGPSWAPPWASPAARRGRRPSWSSRSMGEGDRQGDRRTPGRRGTELPPLQAPPPGCIWGSRTGGRHRGRRRPTMRSSPSAEGRWSRSPWAQISRASSRGTSCTGLYFSGCATTYPSGIQSVPARPPQTQGRRPSGWWPRGGASSLPDGAPYLISSTSARRAILAGHSPSALPYPAP